MPTPFVWLWPDQLALATRPGYNDDREGDIDIMIGEDVKTLWSFLTDQEIEEYGLHDIEEELAQHGIRLHRSPIEDGSIPSVDQVDAFVTQLGDDLRDGPVALSCSAGIGRTGTMAACYLVRQGQGAEEAVVEVRKVRFGAVENPEQEDFVREYEMKRG